MVKNLVVYSENTSINKRIYHSLISFLKKEYDLKISSLSINFISSVKLREINKEFLNHDYETDVIAFNYSTKSKDIDGEILISIEDATYNSRKYNVKLELELIHLVIHGMLHLLKFDDKDKKSKKIMKKEENKLINKFNFALFASR